MFPNGDTLVISYYTDVIFFFSRINTFLSRYEMFDKLLSTYICASSNTQYKACNVEFVIQNYCCDLFCLVDMDIHRNVISATLY